MQVEKRIDGKWWLGWKDVRRKTPPLVRQQWKCELQPTIRRADSLSTCLRTVHFRAPPDTSTLNCYFLFDNSIIET